MWWPDPSPHDSHHCCAPRLAEASHCGTPSTWLQRCPRDAATPKGSAHGFTVPTGAEEVNRALGQTALVQQADVDGRFATVFLRYPSACTSGGFLWLRPPGALASEGAGSIQPWGTPRRKSKLDWSWTHGFRGPWPVVAHIPERVRVSVLVAPRHRGRLPRVIRQGTRAGREPLLFVSFLGPR